MAFEWVRDNIAAFGGKPDCIAAYGGSAGAGIIGSLLLNAEADKLFHKMIVYSGATRDQFKQDVRGSCRRFLQERGMNTSSSAQMRRSIVTEQNVSRLATGWQHFDESAIENFAINWGPVHDGDFFRGDVRDLRRAASCKPTIIGMADLEGAGFTRHFPDVERAWYDALRRLLHAVVPEGPKKKATMDALLYEYESYAVAHVGRSGSQRQIRRVAFEKAFGEKALVSVVFDEIEFFREKNGDETPVFLYTFKWHNREKTQRAGIMGAYHSMDAAYSVNSRVAPIGGYDHTTMDDVIRKFYTDAIVNFAKNCDPNGAEGEWTRLPIAWGRITYDHPTRNLEIDRRLAMREDYFNGRPKRIRDWARQQNKTTSM